MAKNLSSLAQDLSGRIIFPHDEGFHYTSAPNNARWSHVKPLGIALCADEQDIIKCLDWCKNENVPFVVRNGGHSYAGFSTTEGLMIQIRQLNKVDLDLTNGLVHVQGGCINQDVANALKHTSYAVPAGRCATVGVAGLTMGGGWGFSASRSGLTCDSLKSCHVITSDLKTVHADQDSHSDLYWASRGGGGGNFGVHTKLTFSLKEIKDVTTFRIIWPTKKHIELLKAFQKLQIDFSRQMSSRTKARPIHNGARPQRDEICVETLGQFWGNKKDLIELLQPIYAICKPEFEELQEFNFWKARDYLNTDDPFGFYDLRSYFVQNTLEDEALETMLNWIEKWPGGSIRQENMGILFAMGGAVNDVKPMDTAYFHRNAEFMFQMEATWSTFDKPEIVQAQKTWLAEYYEAMKPYMLSQAYVNFPNRDLKNWARMYYGENLERLMHVKRNYDAENFFNFQHSIPLHSKSE